MFSRLTRSLLATICLFLAFSLSVAAQGSDAKDAWQAMRTAAREQGVMIASQGVTDYGSSLVAQNVRVYPADDPDALVLQMPELRIEPRGAAIALIPSPQFTVTARPNRRIVRVMSFTHSGEIVADVTEDRISLELLFDELAMSLIRATRAGVTLDEAFDLSLTGFNGSLLAEREGTADITLSAQTTRYSFGFGDQSSDTPVEQQAQAEIGGLRLEFSGRELDMLSDDDGMLRAAFDAGFGMRFGLFAQSSTGTSRQSFDGTEIEGTSTSGPSEMVMNVEDGSFSVRSSVQSGNFSGGMPPFVGEVSLAELGFSLGFPLLATAQDQALYFRLNIDDVLPSAQALDLLGAGEFAGEAISMALELGAQGRLTQDLGDEFFDADEPPFDITTVNLDRLLTRVGDAEFTGIGAFAFLGGMLASLDDDVPNGTGDFVFDLIGGDALMTRLIALGIVPQDQQFFARMMMNGLGRPVGEDHLRSDVAIRPGGLVTVNDAPLPF